MYPFSEIYTNGQQILLRQEMIALIGLQSLIVGSYSAASYKEGTLVGKNEFSTFAKQNVPEVVSSVFECCQAELQRQQRGTLGISGN